MRGRFLATGSLLAFALCGVILATSMHRTASARQDERTGTVGRFQIAAFATGPTSGCFMIDTAAGELWEAAPAPHGSRRWVRVAGPLAAPR
jgi:hypothetical protein